MLPYTAGKITTSQGFRMLMKYTQHLIPGLGPHDFWVFIKIRKLRKLRKTGIYVLIE